jgi:hypothetical protein
MVYSHSRVGARKVHGKCLLLLDGKGEDRVAIAGDVVLGLSDDVGGDASRTHVYS